MNQVMVMRYPEFLKPNGTIGFVAPSFGAAEEPYKSAFLRAVERLQAMGYRTVTGPNWFAAEGVGISSTPERCGAELNKMYLSAGADVLLSVGGGELMCETVPYIKFTAIAAAEKPKWYMGFSDNTNFTFLSATLADTAAIYGPNAASFGMEPLHRSLTDALDVLTGAADTVRSYDQWELTSEKDAEHPLAPYHLTERTAYRYFQCTGDSAKLEGRLLGGCVDCLVTLLGTRFDRVQDFNERYRDDGVIWFLECCDLNPFGMRRAYWQMREAGWFDTAKGFLIGRPARYSEELMGCGRFTALEPLLSLGKPVIADADLGHLPPMLPLVTGALAEVEADGDQLTARYRFE